MGVTLIFPGQGSQYVGMGKNHLDCDVFKNVFTKADKALGFSLTDLCLNGPSEKLQLTENTQPAIVAYSFALYEKLKPILDRNNITIDRVMGHSVGEYSALVASGALSIEDAIVAVKNRGKFMQKASPEGVGSMYAILRVPCDIVAKACQEVSNDQFQVMPANFNEPGQTVISGHSEACTLAVEWLKNNYEGKQLAKKLKVSAPFHCSLMLPAQEKLERFLNEISFQENNLPYIANVDAKEYPKGSKPQLIKENLTKQVCGSVLWSQSIQTLPKDTKFIEVGPGKVLTGLNKKICDNFQTLTLDAEGSFSQLEEFLK